jgi:hypothetical protein
MFEIAEQLGIAALIVIVGSGVLWFRAAFSLRLPENRAFYIGAWIVGVLLASAALANGPAWFGGTMATLALLVGSFFLFAVAVSRQVLAEDAIAPGKTMPAFGALDDKSESFESASLSGKPLLIKFFRGHW